MVSARTKELRRERRFHMAIALGGLYGPTVLAGQREEAGFDYLSVEVSYDCDYAGPNSFKGCSGGSLWQVLLKERDGAVVVDDLRGCGTSTLQLLPNEKLSIPLA